MPKVTHPLELSLLIGTKDIHKVVVAMEKKGWFVYSADDGDAYHWQAHHPDLANLRMSLLKAVEYEIAKTIGLLV